MSAQFPDSATPRRSSGTSSQTITGGREESLHEANADDIMNVSEAKSGKDIEKGQAGVGDAPGTELEIGEGDRDKKDPNEVRFDGEDDPYSPLNQSVVVKWLAVGSISSAAICVTCASSMAASTYPGLESSFGVSQEVAILSVSLFVLGLGSGPLLLSPLSEFIGRKPIYLVSFAAFCLFNFPVAFANHISVHLIFRFFTGFAGSAFLSVAGGTVTDLFKNDKVGTPMSLYSISPFIGPSFGPVIGGFINYNTDWRWTYYVVIIWAAVELVLLYLFCPETFHPQVLRMKAKRLRKSENNPNLFAAIERNNKSLWQALKFSCKTPFQILAHEYMAVLLNLWTALLLGILYLFFNAFPIVFRKHGFNEQQTGLTFLGISIGQFLAALATPYFSRVYKRQREMHGGKAPPESRLIMGMFGAVAVPIGLFWFGATTSPSIHWIVPILGSIPFGAGVVWTFSSVFTYLVDAYRPVAASAMASNSVMRSSFAAGFPLFAVPMYNRLGTVGATCLLGGLSVLMVPLPFVFYRYGARIRQSSRFGSDA